MELFETIKIKKEHQEAIKLHIEKLQTYQTAFALASEQLKQLNKEMWDSIQELYPESKEYNLSLNHNSLTLTVLSKKKEAL